MGILLLSAIAGVIGIFLEIVATSSNRRMLENLSRRRRRRVLWSTIGAGLLLAVGSLYGAYTLHEGMRVVGLPFFVVVLKFERGHWMDHVSPLSYLALVGNAVFAGLLPQVLIFAARKIYSRF